MSKKQTDRPPLTILPGQRYEEALDNNGVIVYWVNVSTFFID